MRYFSPVMSMRLTPLIPAILLLSPEGIAQIINESAEESREDVITVYATSNPIVLAEYPGQVSIINHEALEILTPSTISDALRDIPGLNFSGGPRRTGETPSIRGLSGQNVLILLDGARQSFISAHDGRLFLDPALISRAEVVKGPASSLYGSGAVGGVLAFESVDAADLLEANQSWGIRLRAGYQSVNEEKLLTTTLFTRQNGFDGLISLGKRNSGDIKLGSGADLPSDDDIDNILVKGGYTFTDDLTIEASFQSFNNSAIEPNNGQGNSGTGNSALDRDVEKDITTRTYRFGIDYNPDANTLLDTSITLYKTQSEVSEFDYSIPRTASRDIETTGLSLRNASRFDLGKFENILTIGGDWYRDEQIGIDTETTDGTRGGVPNGESEFTGIFVQLETSLDTDIGQFLIIPGLRYDTFDNTSSSVPDQDNSDDATSLRLAASYGPTEWLRFFGSYTEGFRAPSINELYLTGLHFNIPHPTLFNPQIGAFVYASNNFIPNPDLVPETTKTTELGIGFDFADIAIDDDRLQAKVSYYQTDAKNLINLSVDFAFSQTCFIPPNFLPCNAGTTESKNVDQAEIEGLEAEVFYESDTYFIRASYASIDGINMSDGSDIGAIWPDRFALNAGINLPDQNTVFGARLQHANDFEQLFNNDDMLMVGNLRDSYTVLDLYAGWEPEFLTGLKFDIGVNNVFDTDYERVFAGVSEPGQNIKISAIWQYGQ